MGDVGVSDVRERMRRWCGSDGSCERDGGGSSGRSRGGTRAERGSGTPQKDGLMQQKLNANDAGGSSSNCP